MTQRIQHEISVTGMTCASCAKVVESTVRAVPGVDGVNVSLRSKKLTVEGSAARDAIVEAVREAGYNVHES